MTVFSRVLVTGGLLMAGLVGCGGGGGNEMIPPENVSPLPPDDSVTSSDPSAAPNKSTMTTPEIPKN